MNNIMSNIIITLVVKKIRYKNTKNATLTLLYRICVIYVK